MTAKKILSELKKLKNDQGIKIHTTHGADLETWGVKIGDMKQIIKKYKLKNNSDLALKLFDSNIIDAMYMGILIMNASDMTPKIANRWIKMSKYSLITTSGVAVLVGDCDFAFELGLKWMNSSKDSIKASGYIAYSSHLYVDPTNYNKKEISKILTFIKNNINSPKMRNMHQTRYCMNSFVIAVAIQIPEFTKRCEKMIQNYSPLEGIVLGTDACKVPDGLKYIENAQKRNLMAKKRKSARC